MEGWRTTWKGEGWVEGGSMGGKVEHGWNGGGWMGRILKGGRVKEEWKGGEGL